MCRRTVAGAIDTTGETETANALPPAEATAVVDSTTTRTSGRVVMGDRTFITTAPATTVPGKTRSRGAHDEMRCLIVSSVRVYVCSAPRVVHVLRTVPCGMSPSAE